MFILNESPTHNIVPITSKEELLSMLFEFVDVTNNIFSQLMLNEASVHLLNEDPTKNTFQKAVEKIAEVIQIIRKFIAGYLYRLSNFIREKGKNITISGGIDAVNKCMVAELSYFDTINRVASRLLESKPFTDSERATFELELRKKLRDCANARDIMSKAEAKPVTVEAIQKVIAKYKEVTDKVLDNLTKVQSHCIKVRQQPTTYADGAYQNREVLLSTIVKDFNSAVSIIGKEFAKVNIDNQSVSFNTVPKM